ncbi:adenylate/guanylate cyclase domain-containing protein [Pseudochryseolinea flava]|nr:adenylate/guanylate cyclase domain-containing protein [Pseudochryseolinea flava]
MIFSILFWTVSAFYFVTIRYFGLGEFAPPDLDYANVATYAASVGFSIGLLFGLVPLTSAVWFKRRQSFTSVILIGTCCYVAFFAAVIFIASAIGNSMKFASSYLFSPDGLIVIFHLTTSSALYHFILQINKKFGPGVLSEYTMGKYFAPKEEVRAFMFLDLKSSTHLAETLEHVTYSKLIQDCYAELTDPLIDHFAHVYQYVGDEVVVSWTMNQSFSANHCINFFYAFQQRLEGKKKYFLKRYGVFPEFKAGTHCGKVTVAEVGEIKTEIAYHGDVLNTASRIQSLCNQFDRKLLISETLLNHLAETHHRSIAFVAEVALRGKESATKVFAAERLDSTSSTSLP